VCFHFQFFGKDIVFKVHADFNKKGKVSIVNIKTDLKKQEKNEELDVESNHKLFKPFKPFKPLKPEFEPSFQTRSPKTFHIFICFSQNFTLFPHFSHISLTTYIFTFFPHCFTLRKTSFSK